MESVLEEDKWSTVCPQLEKSQSSFLLDAPFVYLEEGSGFRDGHTQRQLEHATHLDLKSDRLPNIL